MWITLLVTTSQRVAWFANNCFSTNRRFSSIKTHLLMGFASLFASFKAIIHLCRICIFPLDASGLHCPSQNKRKWFSSESVTTRLVASFIMIFNFISHLLFQLAVIVPFLHSLILLFHTRAYFFLTWKDILCHCQPLRWYKLQFFN